MMSIIRKACAWLAGSLGTLATLALVAGAVVLLAPSAHAVPTIVSLGLSPASVSGGSGQGSTGTVVLSEPAPAGGLQVNLSSSLVALAASGQTVIVPAGATSASFPISTNPLYRRYSALAFNATITAAIPGSTRSALLTVTAQARPGALQADRSALRGQMCGGQIRFLRGEPGILYSCRENGSSLSTCTFVQECSFGCQRRPSDNFNYSDVCGTSPHPVALNAGVASNAATVGGTVFMSQPATANSRAVVESRSPAAVVNPAFPFPVATGASSASFSVITSQVSSPTFVALDAGVTRPEPLGASSLFEATRYGRTWLTVVPPGNDAPPPPAIAVQSLTVNTDPINGGNISGATVRLASPSAPPSGTQVALSSSHPSIVSVVSPVTIAPGALEGFFLLPTTTVATTTVVTISATAGGVTVTDTLTVQAPSACVPTTCAAQGKNCGSIPDGCGNTLSCGTCSGSATCGGGGVANVCGTVANATLSVSVSGRSGQTVSSTPIGIIVNTGATGSAQFPTGSIVTLRVASGRQATWSGACSSGGQRTASCTFTLNANGSVSANVN